MLESGRWLLNDFHQRFWGLSVIFSYTGKWSWNTHTYPLSKSNFLVIHISINERSKRQVIHMETIRQQIKGLLPKKGMSAIELSQELRIPEKEVYAHLPHVARSVAIQGKKLLIKPSRCLKCGYVFEERKRFSRPGRCPKCKATYLQRSTYRIGSPKKNKIL